MSLEKYESGGNVSFQGRPLAELKNFRVRYRSNDNAVRTMRKGLSGFSDGAGEVEIEAETAIPKAGMEAEYDSVIEGKKMVRLTWLRAGKRKRAEGRLQELDESYGTDTDAGMTVQFLGKLLQPGR